MPHEIFIADPDKVLPTRYLKLRANSEGGIDVLSTDDTGAAGWFLLTFKADVTISLHGAIPELCDFQLDEEGKIFITPLFPEPPVPETDEE